MLNGMESTVVKFSPMRGIHLFIDQCSESSPVLLTEHQFSI